MDSYVIFFLQPSLLDDDKGDGLLPMEEKDTQATIDID